MTKTEKKQIAEAAKTLKGRRRNRYIDQTEIETMAKLDRKRNLKGKTIRVYSEQGFVPNSYSYRANIDFIERAYDEDGKKKFAVGQSDAKRPHGTGALVTVNNRAY